MRTIVFSKDRPCQLHLLLESIKTYDKSYLFTDLWIIYHSSEEQYEIGYKITQRAFPTMNWVKQKDFKNDVINLILKSSSDFVMFLVDDQILYRRPDFDHKDILDVFTHPAMACISLRLGLNTKHTYQTDTPCVMPTFTRQPNDFCIWNRLGVSVTENFGYPLSVDAHIFRKTMIDAFLRVIEFDTPNSLEGNLQGHVAHTPMLMACRPQNCFINSPINRVQDAYRNKFGTVFFKSQEGLNTSYIDGKRIDLSRIDLSNINACHQELEMFFK
jgi:hypothetical protein